MLWNLQTFVGESSPFLLFTYHVKSVCLSFWFSSAISTVTIGRDRFYFFTIPIWLSLFISNDGSWTVPLSSCTFPFSSCMFPFQLVNCPFQFMNRSFQLMNCPFSWWTVPFSSWTVPFSSWIILSSAWILTPWSQSNFSVSSHLEYRPDHVPVSYSKPSA